ncbi:MAG: TerB N-terminal domain-containing protein [Clostridia bacterium]|nr:TerB N-terminal domain-containing protein [Clostridia bacterium]
MKKEERTARDAELDRFWDIDALLPRRSVFPRSERTDTAEIELSPIEKLDQTVTREQSIPKRPSEQTVVHSPMSVGATPVHHVIDPRLSSERANAPKPDDEYEPSSALLHTVKIYRWKSSYPYYEDFVKTAEKLQGVHGVPCEAVKFFSYVPQYSQMTRGQFGWYLWFRECVRRGEYPETDYSYILLYAYEIINLFDRIDPAEGQRLMTALWLHYRDTYRQLDSYFPEWICDYSLIHHLPPPKLDARARAVLMQRCSLKEFYVGDDSENGYLQALFLFCSNYDYQKSKFCTEENKPLFDRTMTEVLRQVTDHLSESGKLFSASGMEDSRITRDAYSGALCSYRMKRKIEVTYCSFSRSHELRFLITDILKHTENRLRAYLGVRSKLTVYALPTNVRQIIDECIAELLPRKTSAEKIRRQEDTAEYAHLYDAPKTALSLSNAAEIERLSWDTTQKLVDAFEETDMQTDTVEIPAEIEKEADGTDGAWLPYRDFLHAVAEENAEKQRIAAKELGKMPDAVAEEINVLSFDCMGDVLIEDDGICYRVIEDYREFLNGLL